MHGVGKIPDIFAGYDIDESHPTKSNVDGIAQTERLLRELDGGLVFTNLVETDMLWGHRNDPVNFHRCLQDFDRRLPDLLDALRPGDLLVLTSDHGCDPTTPSTDHSREHALLLAYVEGQNAAGASTRASSPTSARPSTPGSAGRRPARRPGQPIVDRREAQRSGARPRRVRDRGRALAARRVDLRRRRRGRIPRDEAFRAVARARPGDVLEVGCGPGASSPSGSPASSVLDVVAVDLSPRMVELARGRGVDARVGDVQALPFHDASSTAPSPPGCSTTSPTSTSGSPSSPASCGPEAGLVAVTNGDEHLAELWALVGRRPRARRGPFIRENAERALRRHFAAVERRDADGTVTFAARGAVRRYVESLGSRGSTADPCRRSTDRSSRRGGCRSSSPEP